MTCRSRRVRSEPRPSRPRRRPTLVAVALALALAFAGSGCWSDHVLEAPPLPTPASLRPGHVKPARLDPVDPVSGLSQSELQTFYHLAEGSEVYPLAFLLALDDPRTGRPFLQDAERFGLIPDPTSTSEAPWILPVGLTAARSRDLRFANVLMVGVNCAACHVGAIEYRGKPVLRTVGAPNTLDLNAYYRALAEATQATLSNPSSTWTFLGRLYRMYRYVPPPPSGPSGPTGDGGAASKGMNKSESYERERRRRAPFLIFAASLQERTLFGPPPGTEAGMRGHEGVAGLPILHPTLEDLAKAGPLERALAAKLEQLHKEELARPAPRFLEGLSIASAKAGPPGALAVLGDYAAALARGDEKALERFGPELTEASRALREATLGDLPRPELAEPEPESAKQAASPTLVDPSRLPDLLVDFVETLRLLRARAEFLAALAKGGPRGATEPGPGRVDAFGAARNIVFPDDPAPETAPINYPHLWGLERTSWFHWDGNTTSLIERNVGQAIGTGALLVQPDHLSTVIVPNIERLERLAAKVRPPAWPEAVFGAIDKVKFRRGAALFRERCAECHAPPPDGQKTADRLYTPEELGTDPNRARNFARPVQGKPFDQAIAAVVRGAIARAGGSTMESQPGVWRTTGKYAARPLVAIWATAPFLHNGSVPTLHHLLLPEDQRPKTFAVGHREYDPIRLGFTLEGASPHRWTYDTTLPGNSNKGHSGPKFGTDLPEPDRQALLEYLKANERTDLDAGG